MKARNQDFFQGLHVLRVLVIDDCVPLAFVLEGPRVVVGLPLQTLDFGFVEASWGAGLVVL